MIFKLHVVFNYRERDQWLIVAVLVTLAALGAIAYFEMGYKEITWKEFVNK
jgi:hypothetical protein